MKVPLLEQPSVNPSGLPDARVSVNPGGAFGQNVGQAVEGLTGAIGQQVIAHKQRADVAATTDLLNQLQGGINDALDDPKTGLHAQRGEAAMAAADGIAPKLQELHDKLLAQAQNPDQARMFALHAGGLLETAHHSIESYVLEQTHAANVATAEGYKATSLQSLANNYANPEARARYLAAPEGPIAALALSPEDRTARLAEWHAQAHDTVANMYLANHDLQGAQAYLAQPGVRDALGKDAAARFDQRMYELQKQQAGASVAGALFNDAVKSEKQPDGTTLLTAPPDRASALMRWSQMPEGPVKEQARAELEQRLSMAESAYKGQQEQFLGRVIQGIEASQGKLDTSSAAYAVLSDDGKAKAQERAMTIQRQVRGLSRAEQRDQAYADRDAIATFNALPTDEQVKAKPALEFPGASHMAQERMVALQKRAALTLQRGEAPKDEEFKGLVLSVVRDDKMKLAKSEQSALFNYMVEWREEQLAKSKGALPSRDEVMKEMANELTVGKNGSWGFSRFRFQGGQDFNPSGPENQRYEPAKSLPEVQATVPKATTENAPAGSFMAPKGSTVRVRLKDGRIGSMPADKLESSKALVDAVLP